MIGQNVLELDFKTVRAAVEEYFNHRQYSEHRIRVVSCDLKVSQRFTVEPTLTKKART